jgi:hypothetical protein
MTVFTLGTGTVAAQTSGTRDYRERSRRRLGSGRLFDDPGSAGSLSSPGGSSTPKA